ncbi:MAG TPA: hypothetical protein VKQ34_02800 [Candidatus Saccharimonadales bacterium]|nr:hypothetical protein [Candidatus Saccharimonadales bacterium]
MDGPGAGERIAAALGVDEAAYRNAGGYAATEMLGKAVLNGTSYGPHAGMTAFDRFVQYTRDAVEAGDPTALAQVAHYLGTVLDALGVPIQVPELASMRQES